MKCLTEQLQYLCISHHYANYNCDQLWENKFNTEYYDRVARFSQLCKISDQNISDGTIILQLSTAEITLN